MSTSFFSLSTRAINNNLYKVLPIPPRDEQIYNYKNGNNKESKKFCSSLLRSEKSGSKQQSTLIKGVLRKERLLNMCLIYTSHKPLCVHSCTLIYKHIDILSIARKNKEEK